MSENEVISYGTFGIRDSGIPSRSSDYTTLVLFHGFGWHSGVFTRFLPLAAKYNARIVLVNRRDYPGSTPLSEEERKALDSLLSATDDLGHKGLLDYMKIRSQEVYDFLVDFVAKEDIPVSGGLILAGWSFGVSLVTGFLANISSFSSGDVKLRKYIKRMVLYDGPYHTLGYPPPPNPYNPLFDPALAPGEGPKLFPAWVSGYYKHGGTPDSLEYRNALAEPRPTILTLSPTDIESCLELGPTLPGGSDDTLLKLGIKYGVFSYLKDAALHIGDGEVGQTEKDRERDGVSDALTWNDLEVDYVWCDQSVWEMPWGTWAMQAQLDDGQRSGNSMRKVNMIRLRGANHFYHWDQPELSLKAILGA